MWLALEAGRHGRILVALLNAYSIARLLPTVKSRLNAERGGVTPPCLHILWTLRLSDIRLPTYHSQSSSVVQPIMRTLTHVCPWTRSDLISHTTQ